MNLRWLGLALAGLLLCPAAANAGVVISIDMDVNTAGIQSERILGPGDTGNFTVGVVMEITDSTLVSFYSITLRLDDVEMDYVSATRPRPAGFSNLSAGLTTVTGSGDATLGGGAYREIRGIDAAALDTADSAGAGIYTIGTITVTPTGPITDSFIDFRVGLLRNGIDAFLDQNNNEIAGVQFNGGTLTAVPEPSSFLALGAFAGAGALTRYRRRKKVAAN